MKNIIQKIKNKLTKKNIFRILLIVLIIGFAYYFMQYRKLTKDPKTLAKEKTAQAIKAVSALAIIPNDPNTVLANVTDITKLKGQVFFNDAQNGDEIIIFPSAMRAVLYRPSVNKIINIGPLSSNSDTASTTQTPVNTTTTATKKAIPAKTTTTKTPTKK